MFTRFARLALLTAPVLMLGGAVLVRAQNTDAFHFPDPSQEESTQDPAALAIVDDACRGRLKNGRILFLVAEQQGDQWLTSQDRYQPLLQVIDKRLRALGFRIYTPSEIKATIAQAEIDAYFKNDPDAALAASRKLGANYVLRGTISSQSGVNAVVQVNEVAVSIDMTLSGLDGHPVAEVSEHGESFSGSDTLHTVEALVNERADELVARLASDYCRQNGKQR